MAWATTWPAGIDPDHVSVVLRHDNGTQFTADRYRADAKTLGITLSRTAYRHPDGNAFIERLYRTLKEECVWPNEAPRDSWRLQSLRGWSNAQPWEVPRRAA